MRAIDGGSAQFQNVRAQRFIGGKIKLLLGVVAQVMRCGCAGLHPVGAHNTFGRVALQLVLHQQVLAEEVELVGIQACLVGAD